MTDSSKVAIGESSPVKVSCSFTNSTRTPLPVPFQPGDLAGAGFDAEHAGCNHARPARTHKLGGLPMLSDDLPQDASSRAEAWWSWRAPRRVRYGRRQALVAPEPAARLESI